MAKPMRLITEIKGSDAKRLARELEKPNPKRDEAIRKARALKISFA